ncbi:MAG: U32 family peptidase, partial [bacterium]|nr:U32 family peptidase [bacterium]
MISRGTTSARMGKKHKIQLVAPAGNTEKLKTAFMYGADAVYIGYPDLNLRAHTDDFKSGDIKAALKKTKSSGRKIYIALNSYIRNGDLKKAERAVKKIDIMKPDAVIVSDAGMIEIARRFLRKDIKIHLSTQANTL